MKIEKKKGPSAFDSRSIILGLIAVLLCSTVWCNLASASDFDWSDNFDDGNYDGWTVIQGGFGVTDGVLVGTANGPGDASCSIYHESNVSMGTWSFDVYIPPDLATKWSPIAFMAESPTHLSDMYYVVEFYNTEMYLSRYNDLSQTIVDNYDFPGGTHCGLHHISVIRNETNYFYLFHNGTLVIEGVSIVPAIEWEYFVFYSYLNPEAAWIDNVNVTEYVEDETTTTTTGEETTTTTTTTNGGTPPLPLPLELVALGGGVAVVLIVLVIIMKKKS
jgi:hypothetical protein